MRNLELNEKNTTNKTENHEKILQIVQMYFTTRKERNIIMEISYWTEILKNYVNKEKPLEKTENKLVTFIKENKEEIRKMDTYSNKKTQTEEERDNVKDLQNFLHDNSSVSSLYPPDHWGLTWDTEGENLVPKGNTFNLKDLYAYGNYDNVLRNEYGG